MPFLSLIFLLFVIGLPYTAQTAIRLAQHIRLRC